MKKQTITDRSVDKPLSYAQKTKKNRGGIEILEKIELGLYKSSNLVIAVTEAFRQNLIARGIDGNKIKVITAIIFATHIYKTEQENK